MQRVKRKKLELQTDVEIFRSTQLLQALRAQKMSLENVNAEIVVRKAEGIALSSIKDAEGRATALKLEAEGKAVAIETEAKARAIARKLEAEAEAKAVEYKAYADYIKKQQEAKGILELRQAEADGLTRLIGSAGTVESLNQYLMVRDDILPKLAHEQAEALKGMKINNNVWQTGTKEDGVKGFTGVVSDLLKTGVPLLENIKNQTGYDFLKRYKTSD